MLDCLIYLTMYKPNIMYSYVCVLASNLNEEKIIYRYKELLDI